MNSAAKFKLCGRIEIDTTTKPATLEISSAGFAHLQVVR